jgi:peptide-methionine (S)-S-oxide reductase
MKREALRLTLITTIGALAILAAVVPWARSEDRALSHSLSRATFAGGCFWCMEPAFEKLPGVVSVTSGYTGGAVSASASDPAPTYEQVSTGQTGHYEAVEVVFDPRKISYATLLDTFWVNVDPENPDGQFCDFGPQYRAAIFAADQTQRALAEQSIERLRRSRRWVRFSTQVLPASTFHPAEEYHQDYYRKNPIRYRFYRQGCGRDDRLDILWGDRRRRQDVAR